MQESSAFSLTSLEWKGLLKEKGASPTVIKYWLKGLYQDRKIWDKHLSQELLKTLASQFTFDLPEISSSHESEDGTVKFLVKFSDGMEVETVLIPFHKRYTVCLSTQVGCGMNCQFCFTGTQGLKRNLSAGEIVGQYLVATKWLKENDRSKVKPNIVFMGQGEPLHNVDQVKAAVDVFIDRETVEVGRRQMTLSTVGFLPGMKSLKDFPRINIALSLHSPFQEERKTLIPVAAQNDLSSVMAALDEIPLLSRQFITYEYILLKDLNMSDRHVEGLHELLGSRPAILNLIPFNPYPGAAYQRPTASEIEEFRQKLVAKKLRVMVRTTKGDDILAACGQLKIKRLEKNRGK